MSSVSTARWLQLKGQYEGGALLVERMDPEISECLIGVDANGFLHLLVAIREEPQSLPQELEAIVVQTIETDKLYLDISAKGHYEMIFTPLVNQIFSGIYVQGRNSIEVVIETIEEFRGALKPIKPDLTMSEQIGLVGELWVLSNALIPIIGTRACYLWSGPNSERHDFIGDGVHIEVKTTTKSENRHEISRLDQLRAPTEKKLIFASIQVERTDGGAITIATLIDEVIFALGTDGKAIAAFEDRLSKLRWHDGLRQSSELKKFSLRDAQFFEVEGSFPRLADDFVPPRGIIAMKYTIDVSSRPVLDRGEVDQLVKLM